VEERLGSYKAILRQELRDHGIRFDFHLWVSDEWFCPDGVPGFALPFYLFNKELFKIHKKETGLSEGRTDREILKLMRHELGHVVDNAFGLRKNLQRQNLFGSSQQNYPEHYRPRRFSKNFIHYLGDNYAQSHPDEDFAETFAYWLDPNKAWRFKNLSSKVTLKLELMDQLMHESRHQQSRLKNKFRIEPIEKNTTTLKDYYDEFKRQRSGECFKRVDHNLRSTFIASSPSQKRATLAGFLRKNRKKQVLLISKSEGVFLYEAEFVLKKIIERAESLAIQAPMAELKRKSPTLLARNFRYLKEKDQLKFYL